MTDIEKLKDLVKKYQLTLSDANFSRNEKNAMKQIIADIELSNEDIRYIESQIFDIARQYINSSNYQKILDWVEIANKTLNHPDQKTIDDAFFSPGDDCVNAIIECIEKTAISLDICVFTITDNRISRKIIEAHERGVKIRIISDNDKSQDRGSDITEMFKHGIPTKIDYTADHMHHKFAIFDNKMLVTGSYNWTRSAGNSNYENILITNNNDVIKKYKNEFEDLWLNMMDLGYNPNY